jgi:two-component system, NarL family, invasion response regulator UvrY
MTEFKSSVIKSGSKILIADDHPLFRRGLRDAFCLTSFKNSQISEVSDGFEAIAFALKETPSVIFMDIKMPNLNGLEASKEILQKLPDCKIIVVSQFDELPLILNLFKIGVKGFLNKNFEIEQLEESLRSVLMGDYYFHSQFDQRVAQWIAQGLKQSVPYLQFTPREIQLVVLMSKGKTNSEIASLLEVSARSVETYRYSLIQKAKVKNSNELISYVYRCGIGSPQEELS